MGKFGWSLPPGCHSLPGDEPEGPCSLCGNSVDACICPECAECGAHGCIEHAPDADLLERHELLTHLLWVVERERQRRKLKTWQEREAAALEEQAEQERRAFWAAMPASVDDVD